MNPLRRFVWQRRPQGAFLFCARVICGSLFLLHGELSPAARAEEPRSRLRPPAVLHCDRNQLTSYTGALSTYARSRDATRIGIHTDEGTEETVLLAHPGADPVAAFLANGRAFEKDALSKLESAPGVPRPGLRLTAWVCLDGRTPPVIDWQLPD